MDKLTDKQVADLVFHGKREISELPTNRRGNVERLVKALHDQATVPSVKAEESARIIDFSGLKKTALQAIALDMKIDFSPSHTKSELIALLEAETLKLAEDSENASTK